MELQCRDSAGSITDRARGPLDVPGAVLSFNCFGTITATCDLAGSLTRKLVSFEVFEPITQPERTTALPFGAARASATRNTDQRVLQYYTCGIGIKPLTLPGPFTLNQVP